MTFQELATKIDEAEAKIEESCKEVVEAEKAVVAAQAVLREKSISHDACLRSRLDLISELQVKMGMKKQAEPSTSELKKLYLDSAAMTRKS